MKTTIKINLSNLEAADFFGKTEQEIKPSQAHYEQFMERAAARDGYEVEFFNGMVGEDDKYEGGETENDWDEPDFSSAKTWLERVSNNWAVASREKNWN